MIFLTLNEEANLPRALASLKGLDCETFVVDSGSTDRTGKIAEEAGAKVVEHPFENYGKQRNWALDNLPISAGWVLHLDADERLTPELRVVLNEELPRQAPEISAFRLQQHTHWMGRWIKHGGFHPFYQARLHRRGRARYEERKYDQRLVPTGRVGQMDAAYVNIVTEDLDTWIARHNRWAMLEAQTVFRGDGERANVKLGNDPIERRLWLRQKVYYRQPLFLRSLLYFLYRYFLKLGFLDGREGLIFHFLHGFWYRFLVDCKIYELSLRARRSGTT